MKHGLILALLALSPAYATARPHPIRATVEWVKRHPATAAIVTGFVAGTIYIAAQGTNHPPSAHDIQTPRVNCTGSSCL